MKWFLRSENTYNGQQPTPHDLMTERLAYLIFCVPPTMACHACQELQTMIDQGAKYSLSCLLATTRQEVMTL